MTLRTETIDLDEAVEQIHSQMDEIADQKIGTESDAVAERLLKRGNQLDQQRQSIQALQDGDIPGVEAFDEIELAGLSAGEVNLVEDLVDRDETVRERDAWVAVGVHNAPFVEHDSDAPTATGVEETLNRVVSDLPLPFVKWCEEEISDLSHLGVDEGNGFLSLLREKRAES